jgi:hypothetical protein
MSTDYADRVDTVTMLSSLMSDEVRRLDPDAAVDSEIWPTAGALADHVGTIYRWVASVVRSSTQQPRGGLTKPSPEDRPSWFDGARDDLLDALAHTDPAMLCWTLGGQATAAFWARRMVCETLMHLCDLRASGGRPMHAATEVGADVYADAIDEHFEVFLSRSAADLPALPGSLALAPEGGLPGWQLSPTWDLTPGYRADTVVHASPGDLALFAWDRIRPVEHPDRFVIDGDPAALDVYREAPVHP